MSPPALRKLRTYDIIFSNDAWQTHPRKNSSFYQGQAWRLNKYTGEQDVYATHLALHIYSPDYLDDITWRKGNAIRSCTPAMLAQAVRAWGWEKTNYDYYCCPPISAVVPVTTAVCRYVDHEQLRRSHTKTRQSYSYLANWSSSSRTYYIQAYVLYTCLLHNTVRIHWQLLSLLAHVHH